MLCSDDCELQDRGGLIAGCAMLERATSVTVYTEVWGLTLHGDDWGFREGVIAGCAMSDEVTSKEFVARRVGLGDMV